MIGPDLVSNLISIENEITTLIDEVNNYVVNRSNQQINLTTRESIDKRISNISIRINELSVLFDTNRIGRFVQENDDIEIDREQLTAELCNKIEVMIGKINNNRGENDD